MRHHDQPPAHHGRATLDARWTILLTAAVALGLPPAAGDAAVVISEIHYHPPFPFNERLEFVELHNDSTETVSLAGWRFDEGIEFEFPPAAELPAGGFVVVARRRDDLIAQFKLDPARVFGDFNGVLDNSGEELVLIDQHNAVIDAVRYGDRLPWPEPPDQGLTSLQRLCPSGPSHLPETWTGRAGDRPSPLAPPPQTVCPPPRRPAARIVINEIHYHPRDDRDALEEFVELFNPGAEAVSLAGWRLELDVERGVAFEFPEGPLSRIDAGAHLVVCRNRAHAVEAFGLTHAIGDFAGELSNREAMLRLFDAGGALVDVAVYRDRGAWPHAADGMGSSLERVAPDAPGDEPSSWLHAAIAQGGEDFTRLEATGTLADLFTHRLVISLDGVGECLLDNFSLERVDTPGVNLVTNGDFEQGRDQEWVVLGNSARSAIDLGFGKNGSSGLRLVSSGFCDGDCAVLDSVSRIVPNIPLDPTILYRLAFDYRYVSGTGQLQVQVQGGLKLLVQDRFLTVSPGRENLRRTKSAPPFIWHHGRFPREPLPDAPVSISARVLPREGIDMASAAIRDVRLEFFFDGGGDSVPLFDDGLHRDGLAGDGTYGGELPGFPHNAQVRYFITATTEGGAAAISPHVVVPGVIDPGEGWGFFVNGDQPSSNLKVYHLLIPDLDPTDPENINRFFNDTRCRVIKQGAFAFRGDLYPNVDIRFRGNTACLIKKRNLKLKFSRGRYFKDLVKMNLQGLWTDKSLLREHLAWRFVEELGVPACETEFIRLHLNGRYHGLFLYLEHPDERFLDRVGLDDDGLLYKALQPPTRDNVDRPPAVSPLADYAGFPEIRSYADLWEQETREDGDFAPLAKFVEELAADGRSAAGPSVEFMLERADVDQVMGFQLSMVILNNIDSALKNHFLYRAADRDYWGLLGWDLDLSFGKYFEFDRLVLPRVPGREVGTLNDCMRSPTEQLKIALVVNDDFRRDLNPWLHAAVNQNVSMHQFVDFFLRAGEGFFQRSYLIRLWDLLQEKYRNDVFDPRLDELMELLDDEQADDIQRWGRYPSHEGCRDPRVTRMDMATHVEIIKDQIRLHRQYLMDYITVFHPEIPPHPRLKITELLYDAPDEAKKEELEFVEITNTSGGDVDVSGWTLDGGIRFAFPAGTVLAKDEVVLVVRSRARFMQRLPEVAAKVRIFGDYFGRLSNDGDLARLLDDGPGHPALVDEVRYGEREPWPEVPDSHSIELTEVSADRDNDLPGHWKVSVRPFGTPGNLQPRFLRGDANGDGQLNIADPSFMLGFLFLGGPDPVCKDAADANDDGSINLTDAIVVLDYLFRGGAAPAAPFPDPGVDASSDGLDCS